MSKKGRGYPKTVEFTTDLDVDDAVAALTFGLSRRALLKLIIQIDEDMGDWDFTMKLHKHFAKLAKDYDKEIASDEAA
jgi:hypothetical protein